MFVHDPRRYNSRRMRRSTQHCARTRWIDANSGDLSIEGLAEAFANQGGGAALHLGVVQMGLAGELARDQIHEPAGDRYRVVGEPLVVATD
jgi:hypothetical protein